MPEILKLKKGFQIRLQGEAEYQIHKTAKSSIYAVKPSDFRNIKPKLLINVGDKVLAGSALYTDKLNQSILFTSPVSGTVLDIVRGERRILKEIVIQSDENIEYKQFDVSNINSRELVIDLLLQSGLWPFIRQRPFNIIANPMHTPKSIFISGFDTSPLAPDYYFVLRGKMAEIQKGIDILKKLTTGAIHLCVDASRMPSEVYSKLSGVEIHPVEGIHPAGNVGVQIHHIDPVGKSDVVWVVNPQDLMIIGRFFMKGISDFSKTIAVTGSQVLKPAYYEVIGGVHVSHLLKDNISGTNNRIISGNVLTGSKIEINNFLGFYDAQITVIPEGNQPEFLGWAMPGFEKLSLSRSFFSWLNPSRVYNLDTNTHGEERAFVVTGEYEKVLPMDIYPVFLLKAILAEDIEKMEQLGIYEVVEEDFALCEFVCTSKINVQQIITKGIEMMLKELN